MIHSDNTSQPRALSKPTWMVRPRQTTTAETDMTEISGGGGRLRSDTRKVNSQILVQWSRYWTELSRYVILAQYIQTIHSNIAHYQSLPEWQRRGRPPPPRQIWRRLRRRKMIASWISSLFSPKLFLSLWKGGCAKRSKKGHKTERLKKSPS